MKRTMLFVTALLTLTAVVTIDASAQVASSDQASNASNLDVRFTNPSNGEQMSLTKNLDEIPLLIVLDNSIVENSQDKSANINANKQTFFKKELAAILGVKPKQIKAYMILKGNDATAIWGMRGFNGVLDVYSPKHYKQLKKEGKLDTRLQLAK